MIKFSDIKLGDKFFRVSPLSGTVSEVVVASITNSTWREACIELKGQDIFTEETLYERNAGCLFYTKEDALANKVQIQIEYLEERRIPAIKKSLQEAEENLQTLKGL